MPQAPRPTVTVSTMLLDAVDITETLASPKLLMKPTASGERQAVSAAGVGAAHTPAWQTSSPLHVLPSPHACPSGAARQPLEQQSPSTSLPSSHSSAVWLTTPSPQRAGAVVEVLLLLDVVVLLLVLTVELVLVLVLVDV